LPKREDGEFEESLDASPYAHEQLASQMPYWPLTAYFSPSWTPFQAERGRDFSVIVDGVSA